MATIDGPAEGQSGSVWCPAHSRPELREKDEAGLVQAQSQFNMQKIGLVEMTNKIRSTKKARL
jgi:hypothetical protein